jgi:hypothetical protein
MEIRGSSFTAFIDVLTNNTYAMIVMSDPNIRTFDILYMLARLLTFLYYRICCYFTQYRCCQKTF